LTVTATPVVIPVVEYEPPAAGTARYRRQHGAAPATAATPAAARLAPSIDTPSEKHRAASVFADAALRAVLEVIDRRRIPAQLRHLLAPDLVDAVTFARAAATPGCAAVLRRVRVQAVDSDEDVFEVAAGYSRGRRHHAMACRVQRIATDTQGATWQVAALHIG
jgi:hypothetical protein